MKGSILRELILNNAYLRGVQRLRMLGCSEVETGRAELLRSLAMEPGTTTLSGLIDSKVYPNRITQAQDLPVLVYQAVSVQPNDTKNGPSGVDEKRWQINVYGADYGLCEDIRDLLRMDIDRFQGEVLGVQIQGVQFLDENDQFDDAGRVAGVSSDYKIRAIRSTI
jgi:hypothetical protein